MIKIIDWEHEPRQIGVNYNDLAWLAIPAPRINGSWLSGSDLDRYCEAWDPAQRANRHEANAEWQFVLSCLVEPEPEGEPQDVVDRVIQYRQGVFRELLRDSELGANARIIEGNGPHEYTVPQDCSFFRLVVWSSGGETWAEGPGLYYTSGCQVEPGDTVYINIGTTTTLTSSMGSIELFSGWSAPGQVPSAVYRTLPWGHVGRAGAVLIY